MTTLELTVERTDDEAVIRAVGDLDVHSAHDLYTTATGLAEDGNGVVVFELSGVDFIDSTGLGMLIRSRDDLSRDYRARLVLRRPSERVRRMLTVTALDGEFAVSD